jgi:hypothetical protein
VPRHWREYTGRVFGAACTRKCSFVARLFQRDRHAGKSADRQVGIAGLRARERVSPVFSVFALPSFDQRRLISIFDFSYGIAKVLSDVHYARVCHKDIKPGNILIDPSTLRVWLTDFGLSAVVNISDEAGKKSRFHIEPRCCLLIDRQPFFRFK